MATAVHTIRLVLPLVLAFTGCRARSSPELIAVVDLIRDVELADRRPLSYAAGSFGAGGNVLPAIVGPAPGRLTWKLPIPRDARFRARVAALGAPVRVRVGISDDRIYESLGEAALQPSAPWVPIDVDLSAYAGWKVSLFYRPDRVLWHLVLSADAVSGAPATIAWAGAEIAASPGNAREYALRKARLTRSAAP
jgi:hypothetical protein